MDILAAFPGKYRKALDFPRPAILVVDKVYKEQVGSEKETKPVVYFADDDPRGIIINKTNANMLANILGRDTIAWKGKRIQVYSEKVQFGADMVDSIRMGEAPEPFIDEDIPFGAPAGAPDAA
jgi:hypothetical protein